MSENNKMIGQEGRLTTKTDWDNVWSKINLPVEVRRSKIKYADWNILLDVFDKYLPKNKNMTILEIGGAPGDFLVYMYKNFGYKIHAIDYSEIGCRKMKENFDLLNIPITIFQGDIFHTDDNYLGKYDIVYSLGFIEHFNDLDTVIKKHLEFLKPGGILLIDTPNFLGINGFFVKKLAPRAFSKHNLSAMDISNWKTFENKFNLKPLFKGYIFIPARCCNPEKNTIFTKILTMIWRIVNYILYALYLFRPFRKYINSKYFGSLLIGIYKK